jgi:hypothetical protein
MIVALGLYSYNVREILMSLALFAAAFCLVGLVALGMFLIWWAGEKVAIRTVALSRRFIVAYTRP